MDSLRERGRGKGEGTQQGKMADRLGVTGKVNGEERADRRSEISSSTRKHKSQVGCADEILDPRITFGGP